LAAVDALELELDAYYLFHSTRAELLARLGRHDDARIAYERALELTNNAAERTFLTAKRAELPAVWAN
jgi:RNA polymerase sigma-70 factor (ECF subfamily)